MLVTESRPRTLKWFHAGPLLYGDWGTSRLYVLGLAFFYSAHASIWYLAAMGLVMAAVAWGYVIVCRAFPDGGGVYTSARQISPILSVVGGTLLICDYIVTAALSTVEAFHYFGTPHEWVLGLSIVTILLLGVVNWLGARSAGRLALIIAVAALGAFLLIAVLALPYLPAGIRTVSSGHASVSSPLDRWETLVRIMLALAGIEAVANMTGLMRPPVTRTAKRTIWPVLIEVAVLNLFFGLALAGLPQLSAIDQPDFVTYTQLQGRDAPIPPEVLAYRDTGMKVLAIEAGQNALGDTTGYVFGKTTAIIFGLLLLSATNTAIMAMVSVFYSMAQDKELPSPLKRLNYSGVPWVGLIVAVAAPCLVLVLEKDVLALAELYAIGVVGAIAINFSSLALNRRLQVKRWERVGLWTLAVFMSVVWVTIIIAKPNATMFAGVVIGLVLGARFTTSAVRRAGPPSLPEPVTGWLAELRREPARMESRKSRIMLAARGRYQSEFAVDLARRRGAALFGIYVRTLRVIDHAPGQAPRLEDDPVALESLGTTAVLAREVGVPFVPIYVTSSDIASEILDYTVTFGCDTLIMGKSRRSMFARKLEGDVVAKVAEALPDEVALITRSPDTPHELRRPVRPVADAPTTNGGPEHGADGRSER